MKEKFLSLYNSSIAREGSKELLEYLVKSDFFTAPSSTKFHSSYEGGLCEHSVHVYNRLVNLVENEFGDDYQNHYSLETIAICALLHDICKINTYVTEYRNSKVNGEWTQKPYYTVKEKLPYGHGEKSVFIIQNFMRLTADEAMAINWHMGGFDDRVKGGSYSISEAFDKFDLCVLLHVADLQATYLDEERG
ncbi:MAG: hydrolase [Clostridia bacterium]